MVNYDFCFVLGIIIILFAGPFSRPGYAGFPGAAPGFTGLGPLGKLNIYKLIIKTYLKSKRPTLCHIFKMIFVQK